MQSEHSADRKASTFGGRFRQLRGLLGVTQEQIARQIGVTTATYNRYEKGHREPSASLLLRLAQLRPGINAEWLLMGAGEPFGGEGGEADSSLVRVPMLRGEIAAGGAPDWERLPPSRMIAFSREWLRSELRCDPAALFLMEMAGDSMSPTILPGDLMLVNRKPTAPIHEGVHVLRMGSALLVRRLQMLSLGEIDVRPDNPLYKSGVLSPEDLRPGEPVMGAVVWSGKRY